MTIFAIRPRAFTLVELLVVISIIAILLGFSFTAFQGVQNAAKKTQAKNDVVQLVTSVKAYYTEYGKYPIPSSLLEDFTYDEGNPNTTLMKILMGKDPAENPRQIVFLAPPTAMQAGRYGVYTDNAGVPQQFDHPWSTVAKRVQYRVRIDVNYNNQMRDPEDDGRLLPVDVLAWSPGKDGLHTYNSPNATENKDNVYSHK